MVKSFVFFCFDKFDIFVSKKKFQQGKSLLPNKRCPFRGLFAPRKGKICRKICRKTCRKICRKIKSRNSKTNRKCCTEGPKTSSNYYSQIFSWSKRPLLIFFFLFLCVATIFFFFDLSYHHANLASNVSTQLPFIESNFLIQILMTTTSKKKKMRRKLV